MTPAHGETPRQLGVLPRNEVIARVSDDSVLSEAIRRVGDTIPSFKLAWESRAPAQDQFIAIIALKDGPNLIPAGILVTGMDEKGTHGRFIEHSPSQITSENFYCQWEQIIDWRYRDTMHMKGGDVYNVLLRRLEPEIRRTITDDVPFLTKREDAVSPELHDLLCDIANGRNGGIAERIAAFKGSHFRFPIPQDELDVTPVHTPLLSIAEFICMYGNEVALAIARQQGLIDTEASGNDSLLAMSCMAGNTRTTKELIAMGCNIDDADGDGGLSPLSLAAGSGRLDIVKLLLDAGADPNLRAFDHRTPIFFASSADIAQVLLDAGASVSARNYEGRTAVDSAIAFKRPQVAAFLREKGIPSQTRDADSDVTLEQDEIYQLLSESGGASDAELSLLQKALTIDYGLVLPTRYLLGED